MYTECFRKGLTCAYIYQVGFNINSQLPSLGLVLYTKVMTSFSNTTTTTNGKHLLASTYTTQSDSPFLTMRSTCFQRTCLTESRFFLRLNRLGCSAAALLSKWSPDKREAEISLSISLQQTVNTMSHDTIQGLQ